MDGTQLITNPAKVLHDFQLFLEINNTVDYGKYMKYGIQLAIVCIASYITVIMHAVYWNHA